tara:strand:+ start:195 stop:350 length:156 start_codon:yes stop_codon:yes gene_type:complete
MRAQFLTALIQKFTNYFELGAAVTTYYQLRQKKLTKDECEEITLKTTFKNS